MNKTLINTKVNKKRQSKAVIQFNQFMSVIWINNANVFFSVIFGAFNGVFIKPSIYFVVYFWLRQLRSSILSNLMLFCLSLYIVLGPGRIPQFEMVSWALWWTGATMRKRKGNVTPQRDWKEGCAEGDHLYQEGQPAQRGSRFLSYFPQPIRFGYILHFWRGILQHNIVSEAGRQRTSKFQRSSFLHCFQWIFKYTFQPKCKCFLFVFSSDVTEQLENSLKWNMVTVYVLLYNDYLVWNLILHLYLCLVQR